MGTKSKEGFVWGPGLQENARFAKSTACLCIVHYPGVCSAAEFVCEMHVKLVSMSMLISRFPSRTLKCDKIISVIPLTQCPWLICTHVHGIKFLYG